MRRLADHDAGPDPIVARAAALVRAAADVELAPGLKPRVLRRLNERAPARSAWRLQPIVVTLVLVGLIAIAGAAAVQWERHRDEVPATAPAVPPAIVASGAPAQRPAPARVADAPAPAIAVTAPAPAPDPVKPATEPARHVVVEAAKPAPAAPVARPPTAEASLVLDATHALHYEHDAARALRLLDAYLERYPRGDLVEESLALAIEAASARDDRAAASYAHAYLNRFPAGRFRAAAEAALARFGR